MFKMSSHYFNETAAIKDDSSFAYGDEDDEDFAMERDIEIQDNT